jgi:Ricin-type beta-trefoil lectin domain
MKIIAVAAGILLSAGLLVPGIAAGPALAAAQAPASRASAPGLPAGTAFACPASTTLGVMSCSLVNSAPDGSKSGSTSPSGLAPADLRGADDMQSVSQGGGQTVAIVTAGADATAAADLAVYRSQYGLAACTTGSGCLKIENQTGGSTLPGATISSWPEEIAFDLDVISAVCPNCHLLLLEASSGNIADLAVAANTAAQTSGVSVVDNPYGGPEFDSETTYDPDFDHPGVAMVAATGDGGYSGVVNYPAASPDVTAVGGTVLQLNSSTGLYTNASAWSFDSSGCSEFEAAPSWQTNTGCSGRTVADISAAAAVESSGIVNPAAIAYYSTTGSNGWLGGGGTAAAADIVAADYALAGTPAAGTNPASYPYENPGGSYTTPGTAYPYYEGLDDVTTGSTGTCSVTALCNAGAGYDGPTGLGAPASTMSLRATAVTGAVYSNIVPAPPNGLPAGDGEGPDFCLDNQSSHLANNNKIQIYTCNGGIDSQQWSLHADGTLQVGGFCAGVNGDGTANGSKVLLYACNGHTSQAWRSRSNGELVNQNSGKCLDDPSATGPGKAAAGDQLEIETCGTSAARGFGWYLPVSVPAASGPITVQGASGTCLAEVSLTGIGSDLLGTAACDGSADQVWTVKSTGAIELAGSCIDEEPVNKLGGVVHTTDVETEAVLGGCSNDIAPSGVPVYRSDGSIMSEVDLTCVSGTSPYVWQTTGCAKFTLP